MPTYIDDKSDNKNIHLTEILTSFIRAIFLNHLQINPTVFQTGRYIGRY